VWETTDENGLTLVDADRVDGGRGVALASFFTPFRAASVAFVPGTDDIVVSFRDARPVRDGAWMPLGFGDQRVVERWSLATRTRRWSRALSPLPAEPGAGLYGEPIDHVTVSAQGVFVTRCRIGSKAAACSVTWLGAEDGALGATEKFAAGPLPPTWGDDRADSADGRWSLERHKTPRGEPAFWWIFDAVGRVRGTLSATCARFDERGQLLLEGAQERTLGEIRSLGVATVAGGKACVPDFKPRSPLPMPDNETGIFDVARMAISGDRLVWQHAYGEQEVWSLDVAKVGMPARFTLPPTDDSKREHRWHVQPTTPELYAQRLGDHVRVALAHLVERAPPEMGALPRDAFVWSDPASSALLGGYWGPTDDSYYRLMLGLRPSPTDPLKWRELELGSVYTPGFAMVNQGGRQMAVVAGGKLGLQWGDAASGHLVKRVCETPVKQGRCAGDRYIGLVPRSDGKTAWTYHEVEAVQGGSSINTFNEVDLATGETRARLPAARINFMMGPDEYRAGWLEQDKTLWFAGYDAMALGWPPCVVATRVSGAANEPISQRSFCTRGRIISLQGDPAGRFFAQFRGLATIDFYAPDGTQVLTTGTRGNDTFAQSRDGRFACSGAACDELRCVVGDEARPVTDAACEALRVSGFSLVDELAKPR
jgi:hypothetical protein